MASCIDNSTAHEVYDSIMYYGFSCMLFNMQIEPLSSVVKRKNGKREYLQSAYILSLNIFYMNEKFVDEHRKKK